MRTPKAYTDCYKKGIITHEMLAKCLFSVNKRAKNCRDKERSYRYSRYDRYNDELQYREQKQDYYKKKEQMLAILKPVCIHKETIHKVYKRKVYDYEPEYYDYYNSRDYIREGEYYDREVRGYVGFIVINEEETFDKHYLFYELAGYSFHTPITEEELKDYPELEVKDIGELITHGLEIDDLLSVQFVDKILSLIETGNYNLMAA